MQALVTFSSIREGKKCAFGENQPHWLEPESESRSKQCLSLRLPQSKTYYVARGRREFVFDCGVIGLCPPCTRATPLTGVGSLLVGGWGREPCDRAPDSKPTRQQGFCALLMGGWGGGSFLPDKPTRQQDSVPCWWVGGMGGATHPPTRQQGTESLLAGGFTRGKAPPTPPTHQQGTHPCQGCCPCALWAHANNPRVSDQPSLHPYLIL